MKNTFKKTLAAIMSVLMIAAIPISALAAPGSGTPVGDEFTQFNYVSEKMELYFEKEEIAWDREENGLLYTDENGTKWRYFENSNWIVSEENNQWLYKVLEDDTLYVISNPDVSIDPNLIIPSTLDGRTVTRVRRVGVGMKSSVSEPTLSITIPDTVTQIDYHAFYNKSSLKRVIIPASVKSIEVRAFECNEKIDIYYTGTELQWKEIVVWNQGHTSDYDYWAVTDFDWLSNPYKDCSAESWPSSVNSVYFNVNPDELAPLVPEEEEEELTFWEKIVAGIANFIAKIIGFFKIR